MHIQEAYGHPKPVANPAGSRGTERFGALINLSGRQRMLSQRITLHLVLAQHGDASATAVVRQALATFRDSHDQLVQGLKMLPAECTVLLEPAILGPQGIDREVQRFVKAAEQALACLDPTAPPAGKNKADSLTASMQTVVQQASPLLQRLHALTELYEKEAQRCTLAQELHLAQLIKRIRDISREARVVTLNARVVAARAGEAGREFAVVATVLSDISEQVAALADAASQAH